MEAVGEILDWSRGLLDPALRAAVDTLPARLRHIAGYHIGWWESSGLELTGQAPGKALRPTLALLSGLSGTGGAQAALPAAVAIELVHNFSLLQDDVMDRDVTRRHRPTAWTVFGASDAILTADALLALAYTTLAGSGGGGNGGQEGILILSAAVNDLIAGQQQDLEFESRNDVGLAECREMAAAKTGALIACACALGAWSAGASREAVAAVTRFGRHIGLAFQFVDDLLGIWGDPAITGKPVYSDLSRRKKTLPVVAALVSDSPAGRDLRAVYGRRSPLSQAELRHAAQLVEAAGGRQWCQAQADTLIVEAEQALSQPDISADVRSRMMVMARYSVSATSTTRPSTCSTDSSVPGG